MQIQIDLNNEQISTVISAGSKIGYPADLSISEFKKSVEEKVNAEIFSLEELVEFWGN